jgi:hypothetical protein
MRTGADGDDEWDASATSLCRKRRLHCFLK